MTFAEINNLIVEAQSKYSSKVDELIKAESVKEDASVALIRAESTQKKLRLETSALKSNLDSLLEQGRNLRKEASI